jgi:DnaJ-class molecular chaperone
MVCCLEVVGMTEKEDKKKLEKGYKWNSCPNCGGTGRINNFSTGVFRKGGYRRRRERCSKCSGKGGWWIKPDPNKV